MSGKLVKDDWKPREEELTSTGILVPTYRFELKDGSCGITDGTGLT